MSDWAWLEEIESRINFVKSYQSDEADFIPYNSPYDSLKFIACIKEMEKTIELTKGSLPFGDPLYRILCDTLTRCAEGKFDEQD